MISPDTTKDFAELFCYYENVEPWEEQIENDMKLKTDKEIEMTVKEWWASCPAKKVIMLL